MKLDAGDVVVIPFPFTNLAAAKQRPVLVLTPARYNEGSPDVLAACVTSQPQRDPWSLRLTAADLASGALVRESWVRVDKLATIEQPLVRKVVATLAPDALASVRGLLRKLLLTP